MTLTRTILFSLIILLAPISPGQAGWFWDDDTLVTIDGQKYTTEDFRTWWENWREKDQPLPETPDPFIDWTLLYREAERMKLYEDPTYRKKVLTFLKARTLMMLKAEEVDRKIDISDEAMWQRYQEQYAPMYQLNILFFHTREAAEKTVERFGDRRADDEQFSTLQIGKDGLVSLQTRWYRPVGVNPEWLDIIRGLKPGDFTEPIPWQKGFVVLRLQNIQEGDREDFATVRKSIRDALWKEQETVRTRELLEKLREKYKVVVDEKRLAALDIEAPDDSFGDEPVITTDRGSVTEKQFMAQVRRLQRFRQQNGFNQDSDYDFKKQVLSGIIDQTLTTWEGLARGYEKKAPLKGVYTFYCQHRLIRNLEERLFIPEAQVTDEEIEKYYREHIDEFTQPEIIRMAIVEGTRESLDALWTEVAMGGNFMDVARERLGHPVPVREIPYNHLEAEVKAVVDKLTNGEISPVFTVKEHVTMLQLVERKPAKAMELDRVRKHIHDKLYQEKVKAAREAFLARLRAQSTIEINDKVWQKLRDEMEPTDEK
ncbi:peptidyl-prolyl cis-trans isomerase [Desulfolithobacter dissulfuricans]|nr:peptidyl-prolyl cis-trans isomerase [Desulfolithobacter dissulfuricans]